MMCSRKSLCPLPAQAAGRCVVGVSNPCAVAWLPAFSLRVDRDRITKPGGLEAIMHETGYSRGAVCSALEELASASLIRRLRQHRGADRYRVLGYAWFGEQPAPALWESEYEK